MKVCQHLWEHRVRWGELWEREHLKDVGVNEMIILKWIFKKRYVETWTLFVWHRNRWRHFVNEVMNLRLP
jgi:hypothetical protein